jgi:GDPmannose 4,6-dehydratase
MSSQKTGPTALITGITGQDGSYLAERLIADGAQVHGIARPGSKAVEALLRRSPEVAVHFLDFETSIDFAKLLDEVDPDEIYNLAALSSVARSWENPLVTAAVGGLAAVQLMDAALARQRRSGRSLRVLQASSAEMFGEPQQSPQDESTPLRPLSPYGCAKAFAHNMVAVYRRLGLDVVSLILYNHESPRRPDTFVTRKITKTAAAISQGAPTKLVLGNLDVWRDWGWAPDYVDAAVLALRADVPDDYVIASGEAHSIRDFVAAAFACVGIDDWAELVESDESLRRPSDPTALVGDPGKAERVLKWRRTVDFDGVVARMVEADLDGGGADQPEES